MGLTATCAAFVGDACISKAKEVLTSMWPALPSCSTAHPENDVGASNQVAGMM
jgi:hypothetical protein